jgi:CRP-like cAMP-binding protein
MMDADTSRVDPVFFNFALNYLQRYFPVTPQQAEIMIGLSEMRYFDKKSILLNEGEVEGFLNMVVSGLVRKFVRKGKREVTLQLATEGHIIHSEISFLKQIPSPVILETLEPSTLICLSYNNYQKALKELPGADKMGRLLLTAMFVKKDERHYRQLSQTTRERFLDYMKNHPHMLQRVPQKYLASYLNIKPETFSRLKHLVKLK